MPPPVFLALGLVLVALAAALVVRRARPRSEAAPAATPKPKSKSRVAANWQPHEPVPRQAHVAGGPVAPEDLISMAAPAKTRRRPGT
jgi:hypothetical protein